MKSVLRAVCVIFLLFTLASCTQSETQQAEEKKDLWGPQDRATFTWEEPAPYRVFNSITDNPAIGDERNFVRVRKVGDETYTDNVSVEADEEYEIYIYYHNNATARLNESGEGIADNVRLSILIPKRIDTGESGWITGTITSTNAEPTAVWDTAFLNNDGEAVIVQYVPNLATIDNAGSADGEILNAEALFSEGGAKIAYMNEDGYWGLIPGCLQL